MSKKYLSIKTIALREGVTAQAVSKWIRTGKLKAVRNGRFVYVPTDAYREFRNERAKWRAE